MKLVSQWKCVVLRFSRHFSDWNAVGIGNTALDFVECDRDLGVLIDRGLKFHNHVREVVCTAVRHANSLLQSTVNGIPEFVV